MQVEYFEHVIRNAPQSVRGGIVTFYLAEPNRLGGENR